MTREVIGTNTEINALAATLGHMAADDLRADGRTPLEISALARPAVEVAVKRLLVALQEAGYIDTADMNLSEVQQTLEQVETTVGESVQTHA